MVVCYCTSAPVRRPRHAALISLTRAIFRMAHILNHIQDITTWVPCLYRNCEVLQCMYAAIFRRLMHILNPIHDTIMASSARHIRVCAFFCCACVTGHHLHVHQQAPQQLRRMTVAVGRVARGGVAVGVCLRRRLCSGLLPMQWFLATRCKYPYGIANRHRFPFLLVGFDPANPAGASTIDRRDGHNTSRKKCPILKRQNC